MRPICPICGEEIRLTLTRAGPVTLLRLFQGSWVRLSGRCACPTEEEAPHDRGPSRVPPRPFRRDR